MKPSHLQTPRSLAECWFDVGYASVRKVAYHIGAWELIAGYLLATGIGVGGAAILFFGLSA